MSTMPSNKRLQNIGMHCLAFSDEQNRANAFVDALASLVDPAGDGIETWGNVSRSCLTAEMADSLLRSDYAANGYTQAFLRWRGPSQRWLEIRSNVASGERITQSWPGPIHLDLSNAPQRAEAIFPARLQLVKSRRGHAVPLVAAMACTLAFRDMLDFASRVWESNESITNGVIADDLRWHAPVEAAASYHLDGCIARDLALSWLALRESMLIELHADLSLESLRARVAAAPESSSIALRCGDIVTREEVLRVLDVPKADLLAAMEACPMKTPNWIAVEQRAEHAFLAVGEKHASLEAVCSNTEEHLQFIKENAPYELRQLENGALLLATHPYRTLWPLWAEALRLLDIRA